MADEQTPVGVPELVAYISRVCSPILAIEPSEIEAVLQSADCAQPLESFANDPQFPLLMVFGRGPGEAPWISTEATSEATFVSAVALVKSVPTLTTSSRLALQLRSLVVTKGENTRLIFDVVHHAFLPMVESFAEQSKGDAHVRKGITAVTKKIKALDLALRRAMQDAHVPQVNLRLDDDLMPIMQGALSDDQLEEMYQNSKLVDRVCNNLNRWNQESLKLAELADGAACRETAAAEIDFWISLGNALRALKNQMDTREVDKVRTFLMKARKLVYVESFKATQLKVEATLKRVDDTGGINTIMREFPLAKLDSALNFKDVVEAIGEIFEKLTRVRFVKEVNVSRLVMFVKAISHQVSMQITDLVSPALSAPFAEFEQMFKENLGIPSRPQTSATPRNAQGSVFEVWDYKVTFFLTMAIQTERSQKQTPDRFSNSPARYANELKLPLKDRLAEFYEFRKSHSQLWDALASAADAGEATTGTLEKAFSAVVESPLALDITPVGVESWKQLKQSYDEAAKASEERIAVALKAQLQNPNSADEMFRVFKKFGSLLQRKSIWDAVQDFQKLLFDKILNDLNLLSDKLLPAYTESKIGLMCKIRDFPPRAGLRMWFKQIRRQLRLLESKLDLLLSEEWRNKPVGRKVREKMLSLHDVLTEICGDIQIDYPSASTNARALEKGIEFGKIFTECEHYLVETFLPAFDRGQKIIMVDELGNGDLTMRVSFDLQFMEVFKEVRNFEFQHFRIMRTVKQQTLTIRETSVFALMLHQAVQMYQRIIFEDITEKNQVLLAQLMTLLQSYLKQFRKTTWEDLQSPSSASKQDVSLLYAKVMTLEKLVALLRTSFQTIEECMASLKSCSLDDAPEQHILQIQRVVNGVCEVKEITNTQLWVDSLVVDLTSILKRRLEDAISQWITNFNAASHKDRLLGVGFEDEGSNESQGICFPPKITVHIKLKGKSIRVEPSPQAIKSSWINHLQSMCSMLCNMPGLVVDDQRQAADSQPVNFLHLVDLLGSAAIEPAYEAIGAAVARVEKEIRKWTSFQSLWEIDEERVLKVVGDDVAKWNALISSLRSSKQKLFKMDSMETCGAAKLNCKVLLANVKKRTEQWLELLLRRLSERVKKHIAALKETIEKSRTQLERYSVDASTQEAIMLLAEVNHAQENLAAWGKELESLEESSHTLRHDSNISSVDDHVDDLKAEYDAFKTLVDRQRSQFLASFDGLKKIINGDAATLERDLLELVEDWQQNQPLSATDASEALQSIAAFEKRLWNIKSRAEKVVFAQNALKLPTISMDAVATVQQELDDLRNVWNQLRQIFDRMDDIGEERWAKANPRRTRQGLEELLEDMKKFPSEVRQYESFKSLFLQIEKRVRSNRILLELKSDAMRAKHWSQLNQQLGTSWNVPELRVVDLWQANLESREVIVRDILRVAQGEASLEQFLLQIKETWQEQCVELTMYQKKCWLIKGWQDMAEHLDKDISALDDMSKSPFYKPFEEEAQIWSGRLTKAREAFDLWLDVQREFVYLEGIFYGSAEIKLQLPKEYKDFKAVEDEFVGLMRKVQKRPQVMNIVGIPDLVGLLDRLKRNLRKVQKALGEYLERQRQQFSRFYFIGDEDLLEIIGSSNDPAAIQKHFPKMFAGLCTLRFADDTHDEIVAMLSKEGEVVPFKKPIKKVKTSTIIGWLSQTEAEMRNTLAGLLEDAVKQLPTGAGEDFLKWIGMFPSQLVLLSIQVQWSKLVDDALVGGGKAKLEKVLSTIDSRLNSLSDAVLKPMDPTFRRQVEQVLTELVHEKDVVRMLLDKGVVAVADFNWVYQMRFYFNQSEQDPLKKLNIQVANASFYYGFEYLGLTEKLVQTTLTDNIYLTLTQALHSKLGGCPFGPAGTGKTETVKMLGGQLGRFVLTFNCDETFDFKSMGRIFLGICQVGAWGCFDEFNRLEERMLSAVSQQILTIQTGLRHISEDIQLVGRSLRLHPDTGIFITMNPGYAGRSNLPDNLKQLFRNMACTKPDVEKIASVMLYSRGFRTADLLSGKIVLLFKLCLDQLSSQPHYDFGLRALKSVLNSAGSLKRALTEQREKDGKPAPADAQVFETEVLIQSIFDTVVPKLVADDVGLLRLLVRDVFPGIEYNRFIEPELRDAVITGCKRLHLKAFTEDGAETKWLEKVWQLYQIQKLHHGLMLVGNSGCGKSKAIDVLIGAMEKVQNIKYDVYRIDPKAISKDDLYGVLDSTTMEWTDGIFTSILRSILGNVRGEMDRQHWIVLDGDVDPEWVENLNSVLDDNKLLTLPNGERLAIPPNLHMVFEVENLKYATLATVSRCGMVWFSTELVTEENIFRHYLDKLLSTPISNIPDDLGSTALERQQLFVQTLERYFMNGEFVLKALEFTNTLTHVMEPSRMRSLNSMWALLVQGIRHTLLFADQHTLSNEVLTNYARKRLVFSVLFGFGGDMSLAGRYQFADKLFELVPQGDIVLPSDARPTPGSATTIGKVSLVDFEVYVQDGNWHLWQERVPVIEVEPAKCIQSDVVITTIDTVRNTEIAQSWLAENMPMIFCGPPGSGKTMTLTSTLSGASDVELVGINFSAGTTPELLFQVFSQYCEVVKGVSGPVMRPKSSNKRLVVFCDEVNLPKNDNFGTQRVITFMRQCVSMGGYWRFVDKQWVTLERIQFVGACNPPTDPGRVVLSNRFLRFAPVLLVDYPSETSLKQIYGTFARALMRLHPALERFGNPLTNAMVEVYLESQTRFTTELQAHYIYSPRELSRYIRALYEAMVQYETMTVEELVRLYTHEGLRLFYDRLIEPESQKFCDDMFDRVAAKHFGGSCDLKRALQRPILFSNWLNKRYVSVGLEELREFVRVRMKVFYEEELNVKLVVFDDVLHHALRIDRVVRQPVGHALLIGISGCGKSTLSRFVAWMNGYSVFRIKVSNAYKFEHFENDLRVVMKRAGCQNEQICWVFDEMSALGPAMIERMNALLASGEVPGLFEGDEFTSLMSECRSAAQREGLIPDSEEELYKKFVKTVQRNLHVIFTMNPASTDLANSATTSPALFNRCVVDWLGTWSPQAITQVAAEFTDGVDFSSAVSNDPAHQAKFGHVLQEPGMQSVTELVHARHVRCMTSMHGSAKLMADSIGSRFGRHNYITPRSFLDFINQFSALLVRKRSELEQKQFHLNVGIDKLVETKLEVERLQAQLAIKRTRLEEQNRKAEEKLTEIMRDQAEATKTKHEVTEISVEVNTRNDAVAKERVKVQRELAEVEPMVEAAKAAVTSIRKQNLDEIRALGKPPQPVRQTIEMVGLMLGETNISWDALRKFMRKDDFIPRIINFNSEEMSDSIRKRVQKEYFDDPNFNFQVVNNASKACGPLVRWGEAQLRYTTILHSVAPLTEKIRSLEQEANELNTKKKKLDDALAELERTVTNLKEEHGELVATAVTIRNDMAQTKEKVDRSVRMLDSLSSESVRWAEQRSTLVEEGNFLVGDCLVASAFVAYAGYFDQVERSSLRNRWYAQLDNLDVPFREDLTMTAFLSHPDQRHQWVGDGLPNDDLCFENASIIATAARFPLLIDPNGQAVEFLMNHFRSRNIVKSSFLDEGFVKSLESAVRFGGVLLVQDVENLDPIVNPILNKEVTRTGGRSIISVGQNEVDFDPAFQLLLVTRDPNPAFTPDLCSRVTFANFTITPSSMESQCLNKILKSQRPDVEQRRADLVAAQGELAVKLGRLEIKLLDALSNATGNLLENEPLLSTLETIKKEAAEVQAKSADNERVIEEVNQTLTKFKPLATTSRRIFFGLEQMSFIHFLYQFSLDAFMGVFDSTLSNCNPMQDGQEEARIPELARLLAKDIFDHFALSLRTEDNALLAFRICQIATQDTDKEPDATVLDFLLKGTIASQHGSFRSERDIKAQQTAEEISEAYGLNVLQKQQLASLLLLPQFDGMAEHMLEETHRQEWLDMLAASIAELAVPLQWTEAPIPMPESTPTQVTPPQRLDPLLTTLLVAKALRPDRTVGAARNYINSALGAGFLAETSGVSLSAVTKATAPLNPIILAAAPGFDYSTQVEELASAGHVTLKAYAMGTAEAALQAEKAIPQATKAGHWLMFKNVHLDPSFLVHLSKLLSRASPHSDFRLFLTSEVSPKLPKTLLQQSRLLMLEAPGGVKSNLMRTFAQIPAARAEKGPPERLRLYFVLAWVHAVLQERVRYCPVGWSKPYEYGESDRRGTLDMLDEWVDNAFQQNGNKLDKSQVPWQAIKTLILQSTYGGRVGNHFDRLLLESFLTQFLGPHIFDSGFELLNNKDDAGDGEGAQTLKLPQASTLDEYFKFVQNLPENDSPTWVGLPALSERMISTRAGEALLAKLLKLRSAFETDHDDQDDIEESSKQNTKATWYNALQRPIRHWVDALSVAELPTVVIDDANNANPMFRCFNRELRSFEQLKTLVLGDLTFLQEVGTGQQKATAHHRALIEMLGKEVVPKEYRAYNGQELTITEWIVDLQKRMMSISKIISSPTFCKNDGVWLGGLMSPEAFVTATRQSVAQSLGVSLQELDLQLEVGVSDPAPNSFVVKGLSVEGAEFSNHAFHLSNSISAVLPTSRITWVLGSKPNSSKAQNMTQLDVPVYLNPDRQELVFSVSVVVPADIPTSVWYQRGFAFILWSKQSDVVV